MGVPVDLYKVSRGRRYSDCPGWLRLRMLREMRRGAGGRTESAALRFQPLGWKLVLDDCAPFDGAHFFACREMCWVSISGARLTVWDRGTRREVVGLDPLERPRCVDCKRAGDSLYVAVGTERGVRMARFDRGGGGGGGGGGGEPEVWSAVARGRCLAVDVTMAPKYAVCLMENDGVLVEGREGVFRLGGPPAAPAAHAAAQPADIRVPRLAVGTCHGDLFDDSWQSARRLLPPDETVLRVKCTPAGELVQTNARLVSVHSGQLCTITHGSPCFCYDGHYVYAVEQHLYGTCFTVYEFAASGDWCNVGYYDVRANFGIRKVLGLNVCNTRVELLAEGNEVYVFYIQQANYG